VIWRVAEAWSHLGAERFDQAAESARLAIGWNAAFADEAHRQGVGRAFHVYPVP
jgi:hypothetical protein